MNVSKLKDQLADEEGVKQFPYTDTVGKLTIGIGHNLTDNGLSPEIIDQILENDIIDVVADLDANIKWWSNLDEVRSRVIASLCFNMGISKLLEFKRMLAALEMGNFSTAAFELQNSKWYRQVGMRGPKLVKMLLLGRDE